MNAVKKVDLLLATCGHQLSVLRGWQKILLHLMLLICFFRLVSMAVIDLMSAMEDEEFTSFHVSDLSLYVFCISFHVIMVVNRKRMISFVKNASDVVIQDPESVRRLSKRSNHLIIFFFIFYLLQQVFNTCDKQPYTACLWKREHAFLDMSRNATQEDAIISGLVFAYDSILIMCWMAMGLVVYHLGMKIVDEFTRIKLKLLLGTNDKQTQFGTIRSLMNAQSQFDSAFGFIPLLTFGVNFIQTSGYLLYAIYTTDPMVRLWRRASMILVSCSYLLIPVVICMTAGVSEEARELAERLIEKLEHEDMSDSDFHLLEMIEQVIDHRESGLLFEISQDSLLSYAGIIISFAVIFLQLFPNELSVSL